MSHKLLILNTRHPTDANLSTKQPTCNCGWKGSEVADYQNFQLKEVNDQYTDHMRSPERDAFLED